VSTVTLILKDLYPYRTSPEAAALPRLTSFERWMARTTPEPLPLGWRRALAAGFVPEATSEGGAAAGAAGVRSDPGCGYWLATPVHFLAGLDTLRLHPAGLLRVTERRELLLEGPPAEGISCLDPARFLGRPVREGVPQGVGAPALRRLMSEIEMWLHEHPLNELRIAVGKLPISGLWLWGGGSAIAAAPRALPPLFGTDLAIESLWRLAGAPRQPLPARFSALTDPGAGAVVIAEVPSGIGAEVLQQIERDWIAPLLTYALSGATAATLLCADKRFTLNRRARWRFWRRARPWWEPMSGS
jgi:hypothetical protein